MQENIWTDFFNTNMNIVLKIVIVSSYILFWRIKGLRIKVKDRERSIHPMNGWQIINVYFFNGFFTRCNVTGPIY